MEPTANASAVKSINKICFRLRSRVVRTCRTPRWSNWRWSSTRPVNRIPRVVNITGAYKHWDNDAQSFTSSSSEYVRKNQLLLDLKGKYMSATEQWEREACNFSVLQWADCFKPKEEEKEKKEAKVLTVPQLIQARINYFEHHEKIKNGKLVKSIGTAGMYKHLRTSLSAFTRKQYNKNLSRFYFTDITRPFLLEYIVYLECRGIENGNRAV